MRHRMPGRQLRKHRDLMTLLGIKSFPRSRISERPQISRDFTDVIPGAVPCVSTALPGRAIPDTAVGAPRELSPELFPCPSSRVSPISRQPSEAVSASTAPKDAPRAPRAPNLPPLSAEAASARPVLGLSAGEERRGREGRGRRDVADKLRLFCRRQERGDEREAPGGSGCAV